MQNPSGSTWAAIISALFGGFSVFVAIDARKSLNRSVKIDEERRHTELQPEIRIRDEIQNGFQHYLILEIVGPASLEVLDKVTIEIQDTSRKPVDSESRLASKELSTPLWAKYRFSLDVKDIFNKGRRATYSELEIGKEVRFQIEDAPLQGDFTPEMWRDIIVAGKCKLRVICEKKGFKSWKIPAEF